MSKLSTSISIIVLAYNDAPTLPVLVPRLHHTLSSLTGRFEILIVEDGSADATAQVAENLVENLSNVKLLRHTKNMGVGAAFRTGWRASGHEWVGYIDGDNQYDAEDFILLAQEMARGAEMASGRRVRRADVLFRKAVSGCFNRFMRAVYDTPLFDTNSGIKLYTRELLEAAEPLVSDGAFFDAEILIKARQAGRRIVEVPVTHQPRRHGRALGVSGHNLRDAFLGLASPRWDAYARPGVMSRALRTLAALAGKSLRS